MLAETHRRAARPARRGARSSPPCDGCRARRRRPRARPPARAPASRSPRSPTRRWTWRATSSPAPASRPASHAILSADQVQALKPLPEPYRLVARTFDVPLAEVRLVAAHAWDVSGALAAGCAAAFVRRPGKVPSPLGPQPDITGARPARGGRAHRRRRRPGAAVNPARERVSRRRRPREVTHGEGPRLVREGRQDLRGGPQERREQGEGGARRQRQGGRREPVEEGREGLEVRGSDQGPAA